MPVRKFKPTSPGRRFMSVSTFEEITKSTPEKSLTEKLTKKGGRNNNGRITTRHQGGGHKRQYRIVDFKRKKDGVPAKVAAIEYDPNRSARIALLHYVDGAKSYILAPARLQVGTMVESRSQRGHQARQRASAREHPDRHARPQRRAEAGARGTDGAAAPVPASSSSRKTRAMRFCASRPGSCGRVLLTCRATVGQVGNLDHENETGGKAGRSRWKASARPSAARR